MGMEIEFLTFSTLVFGILMAVCFKPLRGTYVMKEAVQQKMTAHQRQKANQDFSKELEEIHSSFEMKYARAIQGELKKGL